jgi:predicted peroxiredoxin
MKTGKTVMATLLAALALLFALGTVQAEGRQSLFLILNSGDTQTQGMAFVLATEAKRQGTEVRVLLCSEAGRLALRDYDPPALKPRNVTPKQMLQSLMQQGAKVEVCALFLPNVGKTPEDLLDGIGPALPPAVVEHMLQEKVRLLTF